MVISFFGREEAPQAADSCAQRAAAREEVRERTASDRPERYTSLFKGAFTLESLNQGPDQGSCFCIWSGQFCFHTAVMQAHYRTIHDKTTSCRHHIREPRLQTVVIDWFVDGLPRPLVFSLWCLSFSSWLLLSHPKNALKLETNRAMVQLDPDRDFLSDQISAVWSRP